MDALELLAKQLEEKAKALQQKENKTEEEIEQLRIELTELLDKMSSDMTSFGELFVLPEEK